MANTLYEEIDELRKEMRGKKDEVDRLIKAFSLQPGMREFSKEVGRGFNEVLTAFETRLSDALLAHPNEAPKK